MQKRTIMTKAWDIARASQRTFGGTVRSYFALSLRLAWAEFKTLKYLLNTNKRIFKKVINKLSGLKGSAWFKKAKAAFNGKCPTSSLTDLFSALPSDLRLSAAA